MLNILTLAVGENAIVKYYRMLSELLITPQGVALLLAGLVAVITMVNYPKWRWYFLGLLVFVMAINRASYTEWQLQLSYGLNYAERYSPLLWPFRAISENSRPLSGILLALLAITTILSINNQPRLVRNIWCNLLALHWFAVVLHMLANGLYVRGASYAVSYLLIYLVVVVGASRWMTVTELPNMLQQVFLLPALLMIAGTFYHVVLSRVSVVVGSNRLQGMTDNPNFIAVISAIFAIVFFARCFIQPASFRLRIWCGSIASIFVVFIAWSGSRTGFVMFAMMVLLFFRRRLSQLALVGLLIAIILVVGITAFSSEGTVSNSRIFSTADTRTAVWAYQLGNFLQSPIFGRNLHDGEWSMGESSYFGALSNMGLVGAAPLFIWFFYSIYSFSKLASAARRFPVIAPLCDLVIAVVGGVMLGSLFEATLFGTLNFQVIALVFFLACGSMLINTVESETNPLRA